MAPCSELGVPCKEPLHATLDMRTGHGQAAFASLYNPTRCDRMKGSLRAAMLAPCRERKFFEATPMWVSGTPRDPHANELTNLLHVIPTHVLMRSRFAIIFREPVSRALSWYNHLLADATLAPRPERSDRHEHLRALLRDQQAV